MRAVEKVSRLLRDLLSLVEHEAETNPAFAEKLTAVLAPLATQDRERPTSNASQITKPAAEVPDVFAGRSSKDDDEFGFWLRSFDLATLKAIVKQNGFDPGKITRNWKEPDKYCTLIRDQVAARLRRGSAFLPTRSDRQAVPT